MNLILRFAGDEVLEVTGYTLNIQRAKRRIDINLTNATGDLSLDAVYDKIITLQGNDETFSLAIRTEAGKEVIYSGLTADYYNSGDNEILHISTYE